MASWKSCILTFLREKLSSKTFVRFPIHYFSYNCSHSSIAQFNLLETSPNVCFGVLIEITTNSSTFSGDVASRFRPLGELGRANAFPSSLLMTLWNDEYLGTCEGHFHMNSSLKARLISGVLLLSIFLYDELQLITAERRITCCHLVGPS